MAFSIKIYAYLFKAYIQFSDVNTHLEGKPHLTMCTCQTVKIATASNNSKQYIQESVRHGDRECSVVCSGSPSLPFLLRGLLWPVLVVLCEDHQRA